MSYKSGGKGQAIRQSDKPSWVGLPVLERNESTVTFKTLHGTKIVPAKQVDAWLLRQNTNNKKVY